MEKHTIASGKFSLILLALVISVGGIGGLWYEGYKLKNDLADSLAESGSVKETVGQLQQNITDLKIERDGFREKYLSAQAQVDAFAGQVQNISGTVGGLVKLSQTDPELLKKYSKVYFLNENYIPKNLVTIHPQYVYGDKEQKFLSDAWTHLQAMMEGATSSGNGLEIISAYRSFGDQSGLKNTYKFTYGAGTANSFSADQGYSEHQLGTAVDFTTPELGVNFSGFDKTKSYAWLLDNAYRYGFILSYPKNNTYYRFEPWHWRFVGRSLAQVLHEDGKYFYDLDQREIDRFLITLFD